MAIEVGDILRFSIRFEDVNGNDLVNVWHIRVTDRGTGTQDEFLLGVAAGLIAPWGDYLDYVNLDITSRDFRADKVEWVGGKEVVTEPYGIQAIDGSFNGANADNMLPSGTAPLVKFRTGSVKTLARKYLWPSVENQHNSAGLSATVTAALASGAAAFMSDVANGAGDDGAFRAVVHSLRSNAWVNLTSVVVDAVLGYQRRRRTGVGS
jgi:hypothetical protein